MGVACGSHAEGCAFYERGVRILADLDEAERCASAHASPRGRVRVNANVPFGHHLLLPLVPAFLAEHPEVTLDIVLTDEVVDLLEQRTDVAVRAGPLKSSSLVARRLGATRMMIVGAPAYLATHGVPATPDDLLRHNRLGANYVRAQPGWPLLGQPCGVASSPGAGGTSGLKGTGRTAATHRPASASREAPRIIPIGGNAQASDGEALRHLTLAGLGLARLAAFQVKDDVAAGRLVAGTGGLQSGRRGGHPCGVCGPGRASAAAGAGVAGFSGEADSRCPRRRNLNGTPRASGESGMLVSLAVRGSRTPFRRSFHDHPARPRPVPLPAHPLAAGAAGRSLRTGPART
jgi:hypothetical protein